ncbi:probable LRR receptor-like serine/threonine-protein kinase At3g47570 [Cornus florida]|uniref:probable LRR receptor-like serine/threonine-protein kinase At3g47570 n=1 Tax=Cornus florida TaxID=4283 RepID=UPI00289C5F82|nr:probable LRR receptor-like serine/threonine-protein kinase At3g47570 [Cornus florida]
MALEDTIPPHIGNPSFLVLLNFTNNSFHGLIPKELAHLQRLKSISLGYNFFSGNLPTDMCYHLPKLNKLDLDSNLLGTGSFCSVYKGTFTDGTILAIKVFNLQQEGASRSFDTEYKMLRNIRHRNLTKVIRSCSNLNFRAFVLQYMLNGSHYFLTILQRLDIMIDVACTLDYLHHCYSIPMVHCDLKPNNILLDEDMVAHLCDFGISKFLGEGEKLGLEGLVSTRSDVYSYGVILMETFTRTKPTDEIFVGGLSLKLWVSESLPNPIIEVIDANLLRPKDGQLSAKVQCVSSIMQLALNCRAESPQDRLNMEEAMATPKKIRHQFLASHEGPVIP